MRRFMDIHEGFVGVTQEQFDEAHRADLAIQAEEGVSYDQAWLDPSSGKAFCLVTGPSREAVMRVHARAGHPTDQVFELPIEAS
jgi:hypothetical protein